MATKSARTAILGLLLLWSLAPGAGHLFAADDQLDNLLLRPVPDDELMLDQPPQDGCLDLLESSCDTDDCGVSECCDCDGSAFCGTSYCCKPGAMWVRADYVIWWTRGMRLPALVNSSLVYDPETVLFGDSTVAGNGRSNFRIAVGRWLDYCETVSLEADYFGTGTDTAGFYQGSTGDPVLARPFFDVVRQVESSLVIAYPGVALGDISIRASDEFESAGVWVRKNLFCYQPCCDYSCCECDDCSGCDYDCCEQTCCAPACDSRCFCLDLIGGYRYYGLGDRLTIVEHEVSTQQGGQVQVGTAFTLNDSFRTTNDFHGGELGLLAQIYRGRWSLDLLAKMALGNNHQTATVAGSTEITVPGQATVNYNGALLALPTNIGHYWRNDFVVIPQFGVEIGYDLTCRLRAHLGYNFLYWANVARAGDQIDTGINPSQIPPGELEGPERPAFNMQSSDFWAHGINAGLELRY